MKALVPLSAWGLFFRTTSLRVLDLVGRGNAERSELRFLAAIGLARDAVELPGDIVAGDGDDGVAAAEDRGGAGNGGSDDERRRNDPDMRAAHFSPLHGELGLEF